MGSSFLYGVIPALGSALGAFCLLKFEYDLCALKLGNIKYVIDTFDTFDHHHSLSLQNQGIPSFP